MKNGKDLSDILFDKKINKPITNLSLSISDKIKSQLASGNKLSTKNTNQNLIKNTLSNSLSTKHHKKPNVDDFFNKEEIDFLEKIESQELFSVKLKIIEENKDLYKKILIKQNKYLNQISQSKAEQEKDEEKRKKQDEKKAENNNNIATDNYLSREEMLRNREKQKTMDELNKDNLKKSKILLGNKRKNIKEKFESVFGKKTSSKKSIKNDKKKDNFISLVKGGSSKNIPSSISITKNNNSTFELEDNTPKNLKVLSSNDKKTDSARLIKIEDKVIKNKDNKDILKNIGVKSKNELKSNINKNSNLNLVLKEKLEIERMKKEIEKKELYINKISKNKLEPLNKKSKKIETLENSKQVAYSNSNLPIKKKAMFTEDLKQNIKNKIKYNDDDSYEDDGFIVKDVRSRDKYYFKEDSDISNMEACFDDIEKEEARTAKIGAIEDFNEFMKEKGKKKK